MDWFGPFSSLLPEMRLTASLPFFHGDLSLRRIRQALAGGEGGRYLVHLVTSRQAAFGLAYLGSDLAVHQRVILRSREGGSTCFRYEGGRGGPPGTWDTLAQAVAAHPDAKTACAESPFKQFQSPLPPFHDLSSFRL